MFGSFDTPDAYTGAYYPHHGMFLVVIGLHDSHIHDLGRCLISNDKPLLYTMHLLCYTLAQYFGHHYMSVLSFPWDAKICVIVGCTNG